MSDDLIRERNIKRRRRLFAERLVAERQRFDVPGWWAVTGHWLAASKATRLPTLEEQQPAYLSWPMPSLRQPSTRQSFTRWHCTRCAVCGFSGVPLYTDHDHATNLVRGLLCSACNRHEGITDKLGFDTYRLVPPAAIWGHVEFYGPYLDLNAIDRELEQMYGVT